MTYTNEIYQYFSKLENSIELLNKKDINKLIELLRSTLGGGNNIYIFGNGGSAATASHYCCDFNKGASYGKEQKFRMICLNDNVPTLMALANDVSYEDVFVCQLENFLRKGDIVIGISGSGNSKNVTKALEYANQNGGITVGITGYDGGLVKRLAQFNVHVPVDDMQITEDIHMVLCHCIMRIVSNIK